MTCNAPQPEDLDEWQDLTCTEDEDHAGDHRVTDGEGGKVISSWNKHSYRGNVHFTGEELSDVAEALREALRRIEDGFYSGFDQNETSSFEFVMTSADTR